MTAWNTNEKELLSLTANENSMLLAVVVELFFISFMAVIMHPVFQVLPLEAENSCRHTLSTKSIVYKWLLTSIPPSNTSPFSSFCHPLTAPTSTQTMFL